MHIHIRRTGGFTAIERRAEVDTTDRPDATAWHALAAHAMAAAHAAPPTGVPDGFRYALTVDGKTAYCADPDLTDEQRELITRVLKEGA
ncbi:protealysin inhibitor emfourin [Streptomyces sp. NPDC056149]|uniref:protealysin inhibitor emfourin n=1 Tax=unclassified Streptomyces TaxID=2593676 RepID=UPI0023814AD3|nr:protealysin inhibitor emfourin [Streptomyces sp. WZ-12]